MLSLFVFFFFFFFTGAQIIRSKKVISNQSRIILDDDAIFQEIVNILSVKTLADVGTLQLLQVLLPWKGRGGGGGEWRWTLIDTFRHKYEHKNCVQSSII